MDIYGTIRVRASILYGIPYHEAANGFTVRYDTGLHAMAVLQGATSRRVSRH